MDAGTACRQGAPLPVLSPESLRDEKFVWLVGDWCGEEKQQQGRRFVHPIRLVELEAVTAAPVGAKLGDRLVHDFSNWQDEAAFEEAFQRLLKDLDAASREAGALVKGRAPPPPATQRVLLSSIARPRPAPGGPGQGSAWLHAAGIWMNSMRGLAWDDGGGAGDQNGHGAGHSLGLEPVTGEAGPVFRLGLEMNRHDAAREIESLANGAVRAGRHDPDAGFETGDESRGRAAARGHKHGGAGNGAHGMLDEPGHGGRRGGLLRRFWQSARSPPGERGAGGVRWRRRCGRAWPRLLRGYLPIADSAESMRQSVPSRMALATSVLSARVGRRLATMDSSIWVAVMTGLPARLARAISRF